MSDLRELNPDTLRELCAQNGELISEALQGALETPFQFTTGEAAAWNADELPDGLDGPGLIAALSAGEHALLVAIPESLPLPGWYRRPSKSQNSRLQTLAMELSPSLLPEDVEPGDLNVVGVENLREALEAAAPDDAARMLMLSPTADDAENADAATTASPLMLAWPFSQPDALTERNVITLAEEAPTAAAGEDASAASAPSAAASDAPAMERPRGRLH
ncbi:MAG: hypothetical protein ACE5KM_08530, partial [Planctomycetaceae bacterium]